MLQGEKKAVWSTNFKLMQFITCHCKIHCDANCIVVKIQTQPQTLVVRLEGCPYYSNSATALLSTLGYVVCTCPSHSLHVDHLVWTFSRDVNMFACVKAAVNMLPLSVYTSRAINQNRKTLTGFQGSKVHTRVFFCFCFFSKSELMIKLKAGP